MIKNTLLLLLTFLLGNTIQAQFSTKINGSGSMKKVIASQTFVVLTGNPEFDEAFEKAFKNNWNITPLTFVQEYETKDLIGNPDVSFIKFGDYKIKDSKNSFKALAIFLGGKSNYDIYLTNTYAYVALDQYGLEKTFESTTYRLPNMVKQLEQTIEVSSTSHIHGDDLDDYIEKMEEYYNSSANLLEGKTLLIDVRYTLSKIRDIDALTKMYKFSIEVVTKEEIQKAIDSKDANYAYLISAYSTKKINSITDCGTGKLIFAEVDESTEDFDGNLKRFDADDMALVVANIKGDKNTKKYNKK